MSGKSRRLLRNWYKRQTSRVRANGLISEKFPVQEGVCQAGVLSPWLFLCFNNDIPLILTKHCSMLTANYITCNPVIVADNITILSTRVKGLQEQHDTLESYSCRWRFGFNTSKTTAVTFGETTRTFNRIMQPGTGTYTMLK